MINRLRSLFGTSGKGPNAGAPAPQAPAAAALAPSQEDTAEIERRLTAAVGEAERKGRDDVALGDALNMLADFRMKHQQPAEAVQVLRRVLAIEEAVAPVRSDRLVMALTNLAAACRYVGKKDEAESLYRRASERCDGNPEVADALAVNVVESLMVLYSEERRYADCEPLILRSIALRERMHGATDEMLVTPLTNLATIYRTMRRYGDAETALRRLVALLERLRGPHHPDIAHHLHFLADTCFNQGRNVEAEKECRRALAIYEKTVPLNLAGGAATLANLGQILRRQGRVDEAEEAYKQALLTVDVGGDACRSIAAHVLNGYAEFLRERGRDAEAEAHAARAAQLSATSTHAAAS
jgi:tetratricopeptide (TPR) repeat protein